MLLLIRGELCSEEEAKEIPATAHVFVTDPARICESAFALTERKSEDVSRATF